MFSQVYLARPIATRKDALVSGSKKSECKLTYKIKQQTIIFTLRSKKWPYQIH